MPSYASMSVLLSLATSSLAQSIARCDGNKQPDWDACDMIEKGFDLKPGYFNNFYPGCTVAPPPDGVDSETLNCRITVCPKSASVQVSNAEASVGYTTVNTDCRPDNAGGVYEYDKDSWILQVSNNPDYNPPRKERGLEDRTHSREFAKRQQPNDNGYTLAVKQLHVERIGTEQAVTGNLPAGSMYTTTQSNSKTTGIESSVSAGINFFEIFSASVDLSVSRDYTVSSTEGVVVYVDCAAGQEGMIYWYPTFTAYKGYYTPSGDEVDWYVPDEQGGRNYRVRCTG